MKLTWRDCTCFIVGVVVGIVVWNVVRSWPTIKDDFFKVTLFQCLQILVAVFVGSVISYWVGALGRQKTRSVAICDEILDALHMKLMASCDTSVDYMKAPQREKERSVLWALKSLSINISLLEKVQKKHKVQWGNILPRLKAEYRNIKGTVTGGTFGSDDARFEAAHFDEVERARSAMSECLISAKFTLPM